MPARLYTKLTSAGGPVTPGTYSLGFPGGTYRPATGVVWVLRTISGVGTNAAANRVRWSLVAPTAPTSPIPFFTWAWDVLTLPARAPAFQWTGHLYIPSGCKIEVQVVTGAASWVVTGWELAVPAATTPPT